MTAIEHIADFIQTYSLDRANDTAQEQALVHILDTLGVIQAGIGEPAWRSAHEYISLYGGRGNSIILGAEGERTDPCSAALINTIAAHTLDLDDMTPAFFGHPGIALLPPLLAFCSAPGISGKKFLEAFMTGAEVCGAIGAAIDWSSYGDSWVSTSRIGILGGAAACAKLLDLDREKTTAALSVAVGEFSGLTGNYGTSAKDLNAGRGASKAVFAVQAAQLGFSGNPAILELYFSAASTRFSLSPMLETLDRNSIFTCPGVAMKAYPVCGSALNAIEAALQLYDQGVRPDDIQELCCLLPDAGMLDVTPPASSQEGKFSLAYCLCLALCKGSVGIDDFNAAAVLDDRAIRLMEKLTADTDLTLRVEKAGIQLTARCGAQSFSARVETAKGDPDTPFEREDIHQKFVICAARRMSEAQAETLYQALSALPECPDLQDIMTLL